MKKFIRSLFEKRDQNTENDPEPENTENKSHSIWEMPKVDGSEKSTIDLVKRDIKIEEKRKLDLRAEEKLRHFRELEKKKSATEKELDKKHQDQIRKQFIEKQNKIKKDEERSKKQAAENLERLKEKNLAEVAKEKLRKEINSFSEELIEFEKSLDEFKRKLDYLFVVKGLRYNFSDHVLKSYKKQLLIKHIISKDINEILTQKKKRSPKFYLRSHFSLGTNKIFAEIKSEPRVLESHKTPLMPSIKALRKKPSLDLFSGLEKKRYQKIVKRKDLLRRRILKVKEVFCNYKALKYEKTLNAKFAELQDGIKTSNPKSLISRIQIHLMQNEIFHNFVEDYTAIISEDKSLLVLQIDVINFNKTIKEIRRYDKNGEPIFVEIKNKEEILKDFIKFLSLRGAKTVSQILRNTEVKTICVNIQQKWFSPEFGSEEKGITSSLSAKVEDFLKLNLTKIDIRKSFAHFKGINTPKMTIPAKIRPIFYLDKHDPRIVDTVDVLSSLKEEQNLAAMDWEDFEHLVAQLFELEFAKDNNEIKVTQSSRDGGIDAIVFDPDPLKGGKYILQAKRYTNVVGVSAVRDLYGTLVNEGANRGILITTSSYGPEAYNFAKDKPISLVDGANLLNLFDKHKMKFRIDLQEAKALQ